MSLTADQKAILFKDPEFLQQAGVTPKSTSALSATVDENDIANQFKTLRASVAPKPVTPTTPPPQIKNDQAPVSKPGFFKSIGLGLVASEKAFGDTIGTALASTSKDYGKALESKQVASDMANKLALQIKQMEKSGKDTTRAKQQYLNITGTNLDEGLQATQDFSATGILGDAAGKNAKQIYGEGLGVATDIIGAGSVGKAKAIKTVGQGIKAGAIGGAKYGAVSGLSTGMQENKDLKGIVSSSLTGATSGAVIGAGTGAIVGKIAQRKAGAGERALKETEDIIAPILKKTKRTKTILRAKGSVDPKTEKVIVERGATEPGFFSAGKVLKDDNTKKMAQSLNGVVKGDSATKDKIRLDKFIEDENGKVSEIMKSKEGFSVKNINQLKKELTNIRNSNKVKLMLGKDSTKQGAWDTVMEVFDEATQGKKLNREGLYQIFQDFNKLSSEAKVYEGADNITKEAMKTVREGLRKQILAGLPEEVATKADKSLMNQFYAITAQNNIAEKGQGLVGAASKARRVIKKYGPEALTASGIGGASAATINALKK